MAGAMLPSTATQAPLGPVACVHYFVHSPALRYNAILASLRVIP